MPANKLNPRMDPLILLILAIVVVLAVSGTLFIAVDEDDPPVITPAPVEVQELPVNFILRPIAPYVYQYLADNYAAFDKTVIVLIATWDDWCYGVTCEQWVVKPHFTHPSIMIRCYPDFDNQCAPTYEAYQVVPAPGQQPTPTNYAPPELLAPGMGVGQPAS